MNQVAHLAHRDREPGEVEGAAGPDVRKHLERPIDSSRVLGEPALRARTGAQHLGGQPGLLRVDVVAERRARHRLPARLPREVDDPVA